MPPTPCDRRDLAAALARWDRLSLAERDELGAHAEQCESCGPALRLLRASQSWLDARSPRAAERARCPEPDALYDYASGPGAHALVPLTTARRVEIEAHVEICATCRHAIETLAAAPPVPLILEPEAAPPSSKPARRRPGLAATLLPLAAAVLIAVGSMFWSRGDDVGASEGVRYPETPLLRGSGVTRLAFPRGPVLANRAHDGTLAPLVFEIVPEDDAPEVSYRVIVSQHDGDPFSEGESVADLRSAAPVVPAPDLRLAPGPYTWEAWSVRNGIPILLGTREFEVVADDVVLDQLEGGGRHVSPAERAEWLLHYLHEHGFLTDARTVAKEQPESPARDTYLRGFLAR